MSEGLRFKLRITLAGLQGSTTATRWIEEAELPTDPHEFVYFVAEQLASAYMLRELKEPILGVGVSFGGIPGQLLKGLHLVWPLSQQAAEAWAKKYDWARVALAIDREGGSKNGKV